MTPEALRRLNAAAPDEVVSTLLQCCAARPWAEAVCAARPFDDEQALFDAADRQWNNSGPDVWRLAFDGHPRIGESKAARESSETERAWSVGEQAAAASGDDDEIRAELGLLQRVYERRFGHIFLICATGKTSLEILDVLRARLDSDPATELRIAAEEQRRITRLRLEKLMTS